MGRTRAGLLAAAAMVLLVACVGGPEASTAGSSATGVPTAAAAASPYPPGSGRATSPTPASTDSPPSAGERLAEAALKYHLLDAFGELWYCDPDEYPVARNDENELAVQRFDEIRRDHETFAAIVRHLGLEGRSSFGPEDQLAVYREWKALNAMILVPDDDGSLRFDYLAQPTNGDLGTRSTGAIDATGRIDVDRQVAASAPACPICLARGTPIETPRGPIAVEELRVGDLVVSLDATGRRVPAAVVRIGSMLAPNDHRVVRLRLDDGRQLTASAGHPLADGRRLGGLSVGDRVDGAEVISSSTMRYRGGSTFDLLASGPTGAYVAGGIPVGSTLSSPNAPPTVDERGAR